MEHLVNVTWEKDMEFSTELDGHTIILDASEANGGHNAGPRPKNLLMVAVAGCTGMDVISILKKMKVEVTYFNLRIEGVTNDEHPKKFLGMKIIYEFRGQDLAMDKLQKAVDLSIDKYCGVNANFRDAMKMSYEIKVL